MLSVFFTVLLQDFRNSKLVKDSRHRNRTTSNVGEIFIYLTKRCIQFSSIINGMATILFISSPRGRLNRKPK